MRKDDKPYRILVVEDNPGDYAIVEELLLEKFSNPIVSHTDTLKGTISLLTENKCIFDIILLDLTLPDCSGEKLILEMSRIASTYPIVVLTGFANLDFSLQSISKGIADYLLKDNLDADALYKSIVYAVERKKVTSQLEASEKRYSDLFHLSPEPMCLYDNTTYRIVKINKAATEHFGYSIEKDGGMTLFDLFPKEDIPSMIAHVKSQNRQLNESYPGNHKIYTKSGELIEIETSSTPIMMANKEFTFVLAIDVTEKRLYEHRITKAIIKTQDDERYEIGGELHDNVCQILATSQICLGMLRDGLDTSRLGWYDQCSDYITMALKEIRSLSHRLAPAFFNESTLQEAFRILLQEFNPNEQYAVTLTFDDSMQQFSISLELQLNLYRILQEQLKNIHKYAGATAIAIEVQVVNANKIVMKVSDNGCGFDVKTRVSGIGLANMKRRTEIFAGRFEVVSSPGNGCTIIAEIPFKDNRIAACN